MPYFRHFDAQEDPHKLLRPDEHVSTPWGGPNVGRCDKCDGGGSIPYRCLSCVETGPRAECPACEGRVESDGRCSACLGDGHIDEADTVRAGVSVFPTIEGLYRYLVERDAQLEGSVIVELEGRLSDDPDLDADEGALLVHPAEIVTRHPIDWERVEDLRRRESDRSPARRP